MTKLSDLLAQGKPAAVMQPVPLAPQQQQQITQQSTSTLSALLNIVPTAAAATAAPPALTPVATVLATPQSDNKYIHSGQPAAISPVDQEILKQSIANLQSAFGTQAVGQNLTEILQMLRASPALRAVLLPEDVGTMVKALRESYVHVVQKKVTNKGKATARKQDVDAALQDLAGLEINI